jgi:hypothetical protein
MARGPLWTKQELETLRAHYPFISATRLPAALPGRSVRSITTTAYRQKLRKCHDRLKEMGRENRDGCKPSESSESSPS